MALWARAAAPRTGAVPPNRSRTDPPAGRRIELQAGNGPIRSCRMTIKLQVAFPDSTVAGPTGLRPAGGSVRLRFGDGAGIECDPHSPNFAKASI